MAPAGRARLLPSRGSAGASPSHGRHGRATQGSAGASPSLGNAPSLALRQLPADVGGSGSGIVVGRFAAHFSAAPPGVVARRKTVDAGRGGADPGIFAEQQVDSHEAADVAQATCIVIHSKYRDERISKSFEAWAFGVFKNVLLKSHERTRRDRTRQEKLLEFSPPQEKQ